jgi:hypothetical protein
MSHASLMRLQVPSSIAPDVRLSAGLWLRRAKAYRAFRIGGLMVNLQYSSPLGLSFWCHHQVALHILPVCTGCQYKCYPANGRCGVRA